jgi:hypothetical protein
MTADDERRRQNWFNPVFLYKEVHLIAPKFVRILFDRLEYVSIIWIVKQNDDYGNLRKYSNEHIDQ